MSNGSSAGQTSPSCQTKGSSGSSSPGHHSEDEMEPELGVSPQLQNMETSLEVLPSSGISSGRTVAAVQSESTPSHLPTGTNPNLGGWLYLGDYVQTDGLTVRPATFIVTTKTYSRSSGDLGYLPSKAAFLDIMPYTLATRSYETCKPRPYALPDQTMPPGYWELMGPPEPLIFPRPENKTDEKDTLVTDANITIKRQDHIVTAHNSWKYYFVGKETENASTFNIDLFKINVHPILEHMNLQDCDTLMEHLTIIYHLEKDNKTTWISKDGYETAHHISRATTLVLIAIARREENVAAKLIGTRPHPTVYQLRNYKKIFNFDLVVKSLLHLLPRLSSKQTSEEERTFSVCAGMDLCLTLFENGLAIDIPDATGLLQTANANFQQQSSVQVRTRNLNSALLLGIFFAAATFFATKQQAERDVKVEIATNTLRGFIAVALTIPVATGVGAPVALLAPIADIFARPVLFALFQKSFKNEEWKAKCEAAIVNFKLELQGQTDVPVELVTEFLIVLGNIQKLATIGQPLYAESCKARETRIRPSLVAKLKGLLSRQN